MGNTSNFLRFFRWFDVIWIIIWVIFLVLIGDLAAGLYSEQFVNDGNIFVGIFAAILIVPPILRAIPFLIKKTRKPVTQKVEAKREGVIAAGGKN